MGILDILKDIPLSAVLKERLTEQEKRMAATEAESATLKNKIVALEAENATLEDKVLQLETENAVLKRQLESPPSQTFDPCPHCQQLTGILQGRKRHELLGEAGIFTHFYKCSNCNKTYDRDIGP